MPYFIGHISKDGARVQSSVIHRARRHGMMSALTKDLNFLGRGMCRIAGMTVILLLAIMMLFLVTGRAHLLMLSRKGEGRLSKRTKMMIQESQTPNSTREKI